MRPLSDTCHKALLPVGGTRIIDRIMDALASVGVGTVTVVTGYRADDIEKAIRSAHPGLEVQFVHNPAYLETNNIVSLSLAFDSLAFDRDVLLLECDLVFDPSMLRLLIDHPGPGRNVALVDRYRVGMDGTVVDVRDGYVTDVYPTAAQRADFSYASKYKTLNIYRFDRDFCRGTLAPLVHTYANVIDSSCYYEIVLGMLTNIPSCGIAAVCVDPGRWVEVDDPNDLAVANYRFGPEPRASTLDSLHGGRWNFDVLDFTYPKNAYFPTGAVFAAMRHALPDLVTNYGSAQAVLNEKLGYFVGCDPARLQVLNGAAQAFPILRRAFAANDTSVALQRPTFGEYERAFPYADGLVDRPGIDLSELERAARTHDVCVVVNPNNPTGTTLPAKTLYELARRMPATRFLIDESFAAFSEEGSIVTMLEDDPLDNVIVLTSLSKCLGVPGLRLGYLYSPDQAFIDAVGDELPVWNLNAPAEHLLELVLKFIPEYTESLDRTRRDREALRRSLSDLPAVRQVHPSGGNFLLVDLEGEPGASFEVRTQLLAHHGIDVKDVTERFSDLVPRLRIAVRAQDDNDRLLAALASLR